MRRLNRLPVLLTAPLLSGCGLGTAPILNPKGPIALAERDLLFTAFYLMLIVVIPVFVLAFVFVWRYRANGGKGQYKPDWSYSAGIDALIWLVPALLVAAIGYLLWTETHKLDPYKAIAGTENPIEVEVVAQDWKWLFIYPEYGIATVNELAFPQERPLSLRITSDTVMNSFMIPALGGQIYAMAGMTSRLHLIADETGQFTGRNTMFSGDGFADQHFQAHSMTNEDFNAWVQKVRQSQTALDEVAYATLAQPSVAHDVEYYSTYEANLFETILAKYAARPAHSAAGMEQ
ncbi:ubiquinol oxidase subunit II [Hoeflea poritis]|uniref:Ubiquinol oxidase subunit 2 n=1 Tax=Hoeflea poritis TaxID=2993659 RepID=A0ABT4VGR5_9HYPH|nr:ubiquinol oxidase subunit II [Hoeflea poritis]MDA4843903.1 ubiquinol oxidase subunit II [Hoeflea poritis]